MGRIFSYSEITAGQVPEPATFSRAKDLFVELANTAVENGDLDGSFIYGSVALDRANQRSDFDTFLAITASEENYYSVARSLIQRVLDETEHKIPILPIVQSRAALQSGRHEIDRFFGQHLTSSYRSVQGVDPAEYMTFGSQPAGELLGSYLFQKKRRMANTFTSTEPLNVSEGGLQRMLELPPAIGRKTLQALTEIGFIPAAVEKSADKAAVLDKSRELFEQQGVTDGFEELISANQEYEEVLGVAINGDANEAVYNDIIRGLHSRLPMAIRWVEQLEQTLLPIFSQEQAIEHAVVNQGD